MSLSISMVINVIFNFFFAKKNTKKYQKKLLTIGLGRRDVSKPEISALTHHMHEAA